VIKVGVSYYRNSIESAFMTPIRFLVTMTFIVSSVTHSAGRIVAETYKQLPPPGIELPAETLSALKKDTQSLRERIDQTVQGSPDADEWRADVEVFARAVELAIEQNLFYKPKDADAAQRALSIGKDRLAAVESGKRGLDILSIGSNKKQNGRTVAGGFISTIDGSVQPYGLVIPETLLTTKPHSNRMDVWLHGRGDTTTEVPFLLERLDKLGQYAPPGVIVLHPFGRHCNAFKFAGETDVYEAIQHVQSILSIDDNRISIRGFSMGGAGVWHLAAHNPGQWFAANPGAGFVETVKYQGWEKEFPYEPGVWGRRLLAWYDVPPIVNNLVNTKVVAYSGENDKQRESAEMMLEASTPSSLLNDAGFKINHVIGKGMGHKIDEPSAVEIDSQLAIWEADSGKHPRTKIHFTTPTLKYHQIDWCSIEGMNEHWKLATIDASIEEAPVVRVETTNVTSFQLDFSRSGWPMHSGYLEMIIDGEKIDGPAVTKGQTLVTRWSKIDDHWEESPPEVMPANDLRKRPGLQGPIDDALTSSFLFVLPSRPCRHGVVQRFVDREVEHARATWRQIMRGDDRFVLDQNLTAQQIANCNLICFGDFNSNRYLASIAPSLPIKWTDETLTVGNQSFDPSKHAALLVYPNPQSPNRYIVVNSGITFRQFSNTSNSRQIAMLPDWAVVDVTEPSNQIFPGKVVEADFFDETWQLKQPRGSR